MSNLSSISYVADGATTQYAIPFNYLNGDHLTVTVGGITLVEGTHYTINHSSKILTFNTAPLAPFNVVISRTTPITEAGRPVVFSDGSALKASDLNNALLQVIYALQENADFRATLEDLNDIYGDWQSLIGDPQTVPWTGILGEAAHLNVLTSLDTWITSDTYIATTQAIIDELSGVGTGDLLSTNNLSDLNSASTARTNLGLVIGTDVQAYDAILDDLSGLTQAEDTIPYFDSSSTASTLSMDKGGDVITEDDETIITSKLFSEYAYNQNGQGAIYLNTPKLIIPSLSGADDLFAGGAQVMFRIAWNSFTVGTNMIFVLGTAGSDFDVDCYYDGSANRLYFRHKFASTNGVWAVSFTPEEGRYYWIRISYNSSSTSNDPVIQIDNKVYTTFATETTPVGAANTWTDDDLILLTNYNYSSSSKAYISHAMVFGNNVTTEDVYRLGRSAYQFASSTVCDIDFSVGVGKQFPCRVNKDVRATQIDSRALHTHPKESSGTLRVVTGTSSAQFSDLLGSSTAGAESILPDTGDGEKDYYITDIFAYSAGTPTLTLGDTSAAAATLVASVALSASTWTKLTLLKNTTTGDDIYVDYTAGGAATTFVIYYKTLN